MRISSKGRYAIAALIEMTLSADEGQMPLVSLAGKLGISKVYLEQIFSLLRRSGIVVSSKGAQGGYSLAVTPEAITVCDILAPVELALFSAAEATVADTRPDLEAAMDKLVFAPLDQAVQNALQSVTLATLAAEARRLQDIKTGGMYFI